MLYNIRPIDIAFFMKTKQCLRLPKNCHWNPFINYKKRWIGKKSTLPSSSMSNYGLIVSAFLHPNPDVVCRLTLSSPPGKKGQKKTSPDDRQSRCEREQLNKNEKKNRCNRKPKLQYLNKFLSKATGTESLIFSFHKNNNNNNKKQKKVRSEPNIFKTLSS